MKGGGEVGFAVGVEVGIRGEIGIESSFEEEG